MNVFCLVVLCLVEFRVTNGCGGVVAPLRVKRSHAKSDKACLHIDAPVLMPDGQSVAAGDLVIGNHVWDENGTSAVILTPVHEPETVSNFVQFKTTGGHGTTLTLGHAVFARACGVTGDQSWPIKRVQDLEVGECVPLSSGGEDVVVSLDLLESKGLAHPITASGKIASGGVIISTYDFDGEHQKQEDLHRPFEPARVLYEWAEKIYNSLTNEEYARGLLNSLVQALGLEKLNRF